jgi:pyruvate kinase
VARRRSRLPVVALTASEPLRRQLSLVWGVTAVTVPWRADPEATWSEFRTAVRATDLVPPGARVVVTAGWPFGQPGMTNLVLVTTL